jgi:hypothetical protein
MVVVQVWDLAQAFPMGTQKVTAQVYEKALELAKAQGREKVTLWDLDLAQVEERDFPMVQELQLESALPMGYRLDSELGLVREWESPQVQELG